MLCHFWESAKGEYLHTLKALDIDTRWCALEVLPYRRRASLELSEAILALYAAGIRTRAISRVLEGIYGVGSPQSILRLTQVVEEGVRA